MMRDAEVNDQSAPGDAAAHMSPDAAVLSGTLWQLLWQVGKSTEAAGSHCSCGSITPLPHVGGGVQRSPHGVSGPTLQVLHAHAVYPRGSVSQRAWHSVHPLWMTQSLPQYNPPAWPGVQPPWGGSQ